MELLVEVSRGERLESSHWGHIAVVDARGALLSHVGDPEVWICMRSLAKPVQALPLILTGAAPAFGFGEEELALCCGSLNGQDFQVAVVEGILQRLGLTPAHLQCGVHAPSHRPTAAALTQAGLKPAPVHNNCAGKHAAMLALCVHHGWPVDDYLDPSHPVQQLILDTIAQVTKVPRDLITVAVDGCGAPVFYAPLRQIALAYARLAAAGGPVPPEGRLAEAMALLTRACLNHPRHLAGDGRICTDIMTALPGRVLAKTGAEGGYALALVEPGLGVALKVADGHPRGLNPAIIETLAQLRTLTPEAAAALAPYHHPMIKNHRKEIVGRIEPVFQLAGDRNFQKL